MGDKTGATRCSEIIGVRHVPICWKEVYQYVLSAIFSPLTPAVRLISNEGWDLISVRVSYCHLLIFSYTLYRWNDQSFLLAIELFCLFLIGVIHYRVYSFGAFGSYYFSLLRYTCFFFTLTLHHRLFFDTHLYHANS